jgi:hypothetical protein
MTIERMPAQVGERLSVTIRAGKTTKTFKPTVTELQPPRALCWLGRFLIPGLFDGAHELRIDDLEGGRSRFIQRETFRGLLVPLIPGVLRDTEAGFEAMNEALRLRAENYDRRAQNKIRLNG